MVMDYLRINIFEVQDMPLDLYLYFKREAFIAENLKTKEGREYLNNAYRIEQTKPDRQSARKQFKKRGG